MKEEIEAVLEHSNLGFSDFEDIVNHGIDAGFSGFIYHKDSVNFYSTNVELIWDHLGQDSQEFGYENINQFIASFRGSDNVGSDEQYKNLLTWYFVEKVALYIVESIGEDNF